MSRSQFAAIYTSIIEVARGTKQGNGLSVPPNMFEFGAFEGQDEMAIEVLAQEVLFGHRFDVRMPNVEPHASTPLSVRGPFRNVVIEVQIDVWSRLASTAEEYERLEQRVAVRGDCETLMQALNRPGNLTETLDGEATGIMSGVMVGLDGAVSPRWELVREDWGKHYARSVIVGALYAQITKPIVS